MSYLKVTRVYTFEGPADAVQDQLNRCWFKKVGEDNRGLITSYPSAKPRSNACLIKLESQESEEVARPLWMGEGAKSNAG